MTLASPLLHPVQREKVGRWIALDVFRASAVLLMIQGHTFTELLRPTEYEGAWSAWHTILHGLTAPMFLIGAGLAYGIVTLRSQADAPRRPNGRILRRAGLLVLLGYFLQLPRAPWAEILSRRDLYECATRVGPLQLVGLC